MENNIDELTLIFENIINLKNHENKHDLKINKMIDIMNDHPSFVRKKIWKRN